MRIGITIGLRQADESMWVNGIKQSVIYLAKIFQLSPHKHDVVLLNTCETIPVTSALPWDLTVYKTQQYSQGYKNLDVLIVMGGAISPTWVEALKAQGTKIVSFRLGSEYITSMERIIFNMDKGEPRPTFLSQFDQMWFIPQVWEANAPYLQVLHRLHTAQIKKVPFFWDPMFIDAFLKDDDNAGEYKPHTGPRRLTCFEPNINVVKTFIYPMLIAEMAFRQQPEAIAFLSVLCSSHFRTNEEFLGLLDHLDIAHAPKRCFFEDRHITPGFLAQHTDIVISHQVFNPLNNLALEVAWLGYPLVHNSELCKGIGYYYEGFNIEAGTAQLLKAINHFDASCVQHKANNRKEIAQYLPSNPHLVAQYDALLQSCFD